MTPISNISSAALTSTRVEHALPVAPAPPVAAPPVAAAPPSGATNHVLIARMGEHADLTAATQMPRGAERKTAVYNALMETAQRSQVDALAALGKLQESGEVTKVESMFLPNAILVTAKPGSDDAVTQALRGVANVEHVVENKTWSVQRDHVRGAEGAAAGAAYVEWAKGYIDGPKWHHRMEQQADTSGDDGWLADTEAPGAVLGDRAWGVEKIRAPEAWATGVTGAGVTVGVVDTGLDSQHPAIKQHYRGTNADGTQTNDYNWFDPVTGSATPFDDGDHGTHVAGTAVGGTTGREIGVAPGAKAISAKAINGRGFNTSDATLKALQWMLAPTKTDGTAADPTKGADVINNSWGSANPDDQFMETFAALKAAGIELVTSAGNEGPGVGTVSAPGSYPGYLSVASSTDRDTISSFSSRGPSKFAKADELVPNITGPGQNIPSSVPGGRYQSMSGTSMAAPHVAGAVALLLSAHPQATHDQLVQALEQSAVDIDRAGPDTASGYGRIDVPAALQRLQGGTNDARHGAATASTTAASSPELVAA